MPRHGPRKYDPLAVYLAEHPADAVTLTFAEIEQVVRAPLPPSAWLASFWSATAQALVARPWLRAGWRVRRADLRGAMPTVTFVRLVGASTT